MYMWKCHRHTQQAHHKYDFGTVDCTNTHIRAHINRVHEYGMYRQKRVVALSAVNGIERQILIILPDLLVYKYALAQSIMVVDSFVVIVVVVIVYK